MLAGMNPSKPPTSRYVVSEIVDGKTGELTGSVPAGDDLDVAIAMAKKRAETSRRNIIVVDTGCDRRVATFRPPPIL
jgi:hypothetical protein